MSAIAYSYQSIRLYENARDSLVGKALEEFDEIYKKVAFMDFRDMRRILAVAYPAWIEKYGLAHAGVTAEFFEKTTGLAAATTDVENFENSPIDASFRWSFGGDKRKLAIDKDRFMKEIEESRARWEADKIKRKLKATGEKYILNAGRETIRKNVDKYEGVKYMRMVSGKKTCDWCLMVANRGVCTARSRTLGADKYKFHDNCHCTVVAVPSNEYEKYKKIARERIKGSEKANTRAREESAQRGRGRPRKNKPLYFYACISAF